MPALYLKYRPKSLGELIGQKGVKDTINAAFLSGKLSHAYLFSGPRGTGKTSTARILAKMVNCEGKEIPCNKCSTCLTITDGSNLDLIEIDAASNRGIDDIRALRETIKLASSGAKKKVYIIDEVHMLTTEAFNALLKTLEEPPSHALFILATTDPQKIPQTIASRVTRLDFKLASQNDVLEALKIVADGEKIKIEDFALKLIAKKAEGSFRDAVKLLDQISSSGKEIKAKDVEEILRSGNFEKATEFLNTIVEKNTKEGLNLVIKLEEEGVQIKDFILYVMDILRSCVYINNDLGLEIVKEEIGTDKYQNLVEIANKFSNKELASVVELMQDALEKMKTASIPSLPLELAVVEICESQISDIRYQISDISHQSSESIIASKSNRHSELVSESKKILKRVQDDIGKVASSPSASPPTSNPDLSKLSDRWTFVLETVRQNNFSLEALLRGVKILDLRSGVISIEVPYTFHQRILEQPKNKDLLEAVISDVLAEPVKVVTILGTRPQRVEDIANVELAKEDEIISLAADIFNGKLVD